MAYDYNKTYPYPPGTAVTWPGGSGIVTEASSPYSVVVDNRISISVTIITSHKMEKKKHGSRKAKT